MLREKHIKAKAAVLILAIGATLWFWWNAVSTGLKTNFASIPEAASETLLKAAELQRSEKLPGAEILKNYALASTRPEDDLHAMAHVLANFRLLVKGDGFRMGANEEFAAALLGQNAAKEVFLEAPHACLNAKGQLIDRWGTALFFHVKDRDRVDIRSAGPDREMWTADDLHRRHDGEWHRGADLPE
jgi:hypothetical protein